MNYKNLIHLLHISIASSLITLLTSIVCITCHAIMSTNHFIPECCGKIFPEFRDGSGYQGARPWQRHYIADRISPYSQSLSLRSSTQKLLSVPPHNLDTAARRFSVAAPRLWNSLPLNCRTAPSVNTFKTRLKTFLFASA